MKQHDEWADEGHKARRKTWYDEMEEEDMYFNEDLRDELVEDDEISAAEAGFLEGYEDA